MLHNEVTQTLRVNPATGCNENTAAGYKSCTGEDVKVVGVALSWQHLSRREAKHTSPAMVTVYKQTQMDSRD